MSSVTNLVYNISEGVCPRTYAVVVAVPSAETTVQTTRCPPRNRFRRLPQSSSRYDGSAFFARCRRCPRVAVPVSVTREHLLLDWLLPTLNRYNRPNQRTVLHCWSVGALNNGCTPLHAQAVAWGNSLTSRENSENTAFLLSIKNLVRRYHFKNLGFY